MIAFDAYTLDYSRLDDITANITAIRMFNPWSDEVNSMFYENKRRFNGPDREDKLTVRQCGLYRFGDRYFHSFFFVSEDGRSFNPRCLISVREGVRR